jgi:hypothetical protein
VPAPDRDAIRRFQLGESGRTRAAGFQLEGVRRQNHCITDRFVDHARYAILEEQWSRQKRADGVDRLMIDSQVEEEDEHENN